MLSNLLDFKKITVQGDCRIIFVMEKRVRSGPARNQFRLVGRHYPIWLFAMRVVDGTDARTRSALRTPRFNRRVGGQNVPLLGPVRDRAGRCPRGERAAIP